MFSMALWMAALVAPRQLVAGDLHGLNTLEYQPAKVAAREGHCDSGRGLPLSLFGIPDMQAATMRSAIAIPKLGSLILTHDPDGALKGLKDFPRENWPNVDILFWTFRLMVGLGLLMIAMGLWSLVQRGRGRLYDARWLMRMMLAMGPMGFVALVSGWFTTEVGRQPYTIYGLLRTADSVSPIASPAVGASLVAFVVVYLTVFGAGRCSTSSGSWRAGPAPSHAARDPAHPVGRHHARRRCCRTSRSMMPPIDLPVIWAGLIAFAVLAYVVLDGFDLGLGILFPLLGGESDRDTAMNAWRRCGTATRPGWCSAAAGCWLPSRWPMRWCCRRFMRRYWQCCSGLSSAASPSSSAGGPGAASRGGMRRSSAAR
jgi:hypothetical protein